MSNLPTALVSNIADSEVEILSWNAESQELVLRIEKEIGPEIGSIKLSGVGFVHLPPRFSLSSISVQREEAPQIKGVIPEDGEYLYVFEESWGNTYGIIAESIEYVANV